MDKPEDIEAKAWNCSEYPEWLSSMVEEANEVADRLDMSTEQVVAWAILSAQSQAYIDAARIAEECTLALPLGNGLADGASMSRRQISAAILQRKEEIGRN